MTYNELETILGRPPSQLEKVCIDNGKLPTLKVGDVVTEKTKRVSKGRKVTAIAVFHVRQLKAYTWAVQLEGHTDFFPESQYWVDVH